MSLVKTILTKIRFNNGSQPALNDTNLDQMQTNIQTAISTLEENVETEMNNINTAITSVAVPALSVQTDTTEHILKSFTIETAGRYMFLADVPLNYYGETGRTLYLKLKVNNSEKFIGGGIINTNAYTLYTKLLTVADVPANGTVEITLKNDADGKQFACVGFNLQYFKLK